MTTLVLKDAKISSTQSVDPEKIKGFLEQLSSKVPNSADVAYTQAAEIANKTLGSNFGNVNWTNVITAQQKTKSSPQIG